MTRNQQIQNVLDALEQATDISVDAGITDGAVEITDADGDALDLTASGAAPTVEDVAESLIVDDLTVPAGEVMFVPSGEEIGVMDLVVEDTATFVVDGYVEVFGDLTETGTISGTGEVTDRVL